MIDFPAWLAQFIECMKQHGMPARTADRYRTEYEADARAYWAAGIKPIVAAGREFMP